MGDRLFEHVPRHWRRLREQYGYFLSSVGVLQHLRARRRRLRSMRRR